MYKIHYNKIKGLHGQPSKVLHIDLLCNSGASWCRYISEMSDMYIFLDAVNPSQLDFALLSAPTHIVFGGGYWNVETQRLCTEKIKNYLASYPNTIVFGYWGDGILDSINNVETSVLDMVFCAFDEAVEKFKSLGVAAEYYPHPVDHNVFYNDTAVKEIYDWCFIGTNYGSKRKPYIDKLNTAFHNGIVKGMGFGEGPGGCSYEETASIFRQSKVIININDDEYCGLSRYFSDRLPMGMMCGKLVLTNAQNNLQTVFKSGYNVDTYNDLDDLVSKMKYYLKKDSKRKEIGDNAVGNAENYSMRRMFPLFFETAAAVKRKKNG